MSEVLEEPSEIIVDFNNNDTFSKIKNEIQQSDDKPKPKRKATNKNIVEEPDEKI